MSPQGKAGTATPAVGRFPKPHPPAILLERMKLAEAKQAGAPLGAASSSHVAEPAGAPLRVVPVPHVAEPAVTPLGREDVEVVAKPAGTPLGVAPARGSMGPLASAPRATPSGAADTSGPSRFLLQGMRPGNRRDAVRSVAVTLICDSFFTWYPSGGLGTNEVRDREEMRRMWPGSGEWLSSACKGGKVVDAALGSAPTRMPGVAVFACAGNDFMPRAKAKNWPAELWIWTDGNTMLNQPPYKGLYRGSV